MRTFNNLPIYDLRVENDDDGVFCISLVDQPAIETDFLKFAETVQESFTKADEDKHVLYGPAMIPDMPIYRRNEDGTEYYVTFSRETIAKIAEKFHRDNCNFNISLDHMSPIDNCYVFSSYIIDRENGIDPAEFKNCSDGTWVIKVKVENDAVWDFVKNTDLVRGFSVELTATPYRMKSEKPEPKKSDWLTDAMHGILRN